MKNKIITIINVLIILITINNFSISAKAIDEEVICYAIVQVTELNFRNEPNTNSEKITQFNSGDKIPIYEIIDDEWCKTYYNGQVGYVCYYSKENKNGKYFLSFTDEKFFCTAFTTDRLKLRTFATRDEICIIPKDTEIPIYIQGDWCLTSYDGKLGYVSQDYITLSDGVTEDYFSGCISYNEGSCGDNAKWSLRDNVLSIYGTGSANIGYIGDYIDLERSYNVDMIVEEGITSIEGTLASYVNLRIENVTLPNSLKKIGKEFLNRSGIDCLNIPSSVEFIHDDAFTINNIGAFSVNENNKNYSSMDGVLYNKDKSILIAYPNKRSLDGFVVPNTVEILYKSAFEALCFGDHCDSRKDVTITIPSSVKQIYSNEYASYPFCQISNGFETGITYKSFTVIGEKGSCVEDFVNKINNYVDNHISDMILLNYVTFKELPTNTTTSIKKNEEEEFDFKSLNGLIEDWAISYANYLSNRLSNQDDIRFYLTCIDEDDIPEMLIATDEAHLDGISVYTYYNNEVLLIGNFGSNGTLEYIKKNNYIYSCFVTDSKFLSEIFSIKDGSAQKVCSLNFEPIPDVDEEYYYYIDGNSVTKEEFDKKQEFYQENISRVDYSEMYSISISSIYSILNLLQTKNTVSVDYTLYYDFVKNIDKTENDCDNIGEFGYYYYDINKDGICELIISQGNSNANHKYNIYTIKNDKLLQIVKKTNDMTGGNSTTYLIGEWAGFCIPNDEKTNLYYVKAGGFSGDDDKIYSLNILEDKFSFIETSYILDYDFSEVNPKMFFINFENLEYLSNLIEFSKNDITETVATDITSVITDSQKVDVTTIGTSSTEEISQTDNTSLQNLPFKGYDSNIFKPVFIVFLVVIVISIILIIKTTKK